MIDELSINVKKIDAIFFEKSHDSRHSKLIIIVNGQSLEFNGGVNFFKSVEDVENLYKVLKQKDDKENGNKYFYSLK